MMLSISGYPIIIYLKQDKISIHVRLYFSYNLYNIPNGTGSEVVPPFKTRIENKNEIKGRVLF